MQAQRAALGGHGRRPGRDRPGGDRAGAAAALARGGGGDGGGRRGRGRGFRGGRGGGAPRGGRRQPGGRGARTRAPVRGDGWWGWGRGRAEAGLPASGTRVENRERRAGRAWTRWQRRLRGAGRGRGRGAFACAPLAVSPLGSRVTGVPRVSPARPRGSGPVMVKNPETERLCVRAAS